MQIFFTLIYRLKKIKPTVGSSFSTYNYQLFPTANKTTHSKLPITNKQTKSLEGLLQGSESGGYLLSHNKCSTIGVAELNDPVRNGKGWDLSAITT